MKIGTLFSGIGAPEQAAVRVFGDKFEHIFACEWDKFARQSFSAIYNFEGEHFHEDINDLSGKQYKGAVDIIIGGSPCQDFSIAGLRAGVAGKRGELIWQFFRIIQEATPPVFVYENVKGMLSDRKVNKKDKYGKTFADFLEVFESIGYKLHWKVLNSKDYGVPQNRERVFVIGFLDQKHYDNFHFANKIPLTKRLKDVLEESVDEKYYLDSARFALDINGIGRTIRTGGKSSDSEKHCFDLVNIPNSGVIGMLGIKGNEQIRRAYGTAPCLQTMQGGNREPKILDDQGRVRKQENPKLLDHCPTLRAQSHGNEPKVVTHRVRKLTPLECWRLQDFPDNAYNKAKLSGVSNTQLYKQAGNSMTVAVVEMILRQIDIAMNDLCFLE